MKNIWKKLAVIACAGILAVGLLAGCGSSGGQSSDNNSQKENNAPANTNSGKLRFYTGGSQGTYYGFGQVLGSHATNNADIEIETLTSDGSKANIEAIEDGLAELGFCQSDVMAYAYNGTNLFDGQPIKDFSTLAALYPEDVQIVTTNPDIKTVADLEGKKVSIGAANSGVYFNAIDILGAYGLTEQDIQPTYQSFGDSADALKNGQIDAAFIVAGAPTTAITDLSTTTQAYLVSLDQEHVDALLQTSPYYVESIIPAGTYAGMDTDTTTVAVQAVILVANSVSEDDAYAFVKDIFESAADPTAASAHAKYGELDVNQAASVTTVPYHPGAAKYFKEQNIEVFTD